MVTRKEAPEAAAARLVAAIDALDAAKVERDAAIAAALNAGGSVRHVAQLARMSATQINVIGKANGWPDEATRRRRKAEHEKRHEWDELLRIADAASAGRAVSEYLESLQDDASRAEGPET